MTALGFFQVSAGISTLISAGANTFSTVYGTIEGTKLAKEQAEIEQKILLSQADLQKKILGVQKNIFLTQEEGIKKSNDIDLQIKQARADLEIQKIQNEMQVNQAFHQKNLDNNNFYVSANSNNYTEPNTGIEKYLIGAVFFTAIAGIFFVKGK